MRNLMIWDSKGLAFARIKDVMIFFAANGEQSVLTEVAIGSDGINDGRHAIFVDQQNSPSSPFEVIDQFCGDAVNRRSFTAHPWIIGSVILQSIIQMWKVDKQ